MVSDDRRVGEGSAHDGSAVGDQSRADLDPDDPFFQALVESFWHLTLVFDATGTITYVSPAVEPTIGVLPEDTVGTNIVEYVAADELALALEALAYKVEYPDVPFRPLDLHVLNDGEPKAIEIVGRPDTDPDTEGIGVVLRDTTRRVMLEDILELVMRSEPITETLTAIACLASEQVRLAGVAIAYDPGPGGFDGIASHDLPDTLAERTRRAGPRSPIDTPWERALRTGDIVVMMPYDLPPELRLEAEGHGYSSCWSTPMVDRDGRVVGCLTLWTDEAVPPAPAERDYVRRLARTAAFAIDRWNQDQALAHAARHDSLTGALNRSALVEQLHAARRRPDGDSSHVTALLSIDLDGFKVVNDEHGHLAGDQVLVAVAERIRASVRSGDVVARVGGDEFAVLTPSVDLAEATALADRIIQRVREPVALPNGTVSVGASVGIAFEAPGPTVLPGPEVDTSSDERLFSRADIALYAAKSAGKGCYVLDGDPEVPS